MEPILEKYWQSKLLCSLCDFQRLKNTNLNCHVHPLGSSLDYILTLEACGDCDCNGPRECGGEENLFHCQLYEIQVLQPLDHTSRPSGQNACAIILWAHFIFFPFIFLFHNEGRTRFIMEINKWIKIWHL
jgi:hypothetical protein